MARGITQESALSKKVTASDLERRTFLSSALALSGVAATASLLGTTRALAAPVKLESLDPVDPDIYFGTTGSYFGNWKNGQQLMSGNFPMMLADCKHYGLQGLEPYAHQLGPYLGKPAVLKQIADKAGVVVECVGDLARAPAPGPAPAAPAPGAKVTYPWLGEEGNEKLVADMVAFARDFLAPMGIDHWKSNMGDRPPGGPSAAQLKGLAKTLNDIGRQTIAHGVRLSPHPHMWGPMEREHDLRAVMDNTDPKYVWMTLDTGHNVLGGMDPVKIIHDYFPRISEVHLKDTYPQYIGNKGGLTKAQHAQKSLYSIYLGAGGCDFPAIFKALRDRHFKGWAVFDVDSPRPDDHTNTDEAMVKSINYMRNVLHVKLPPPPAKGLYTEVL